MIDFDAILRKDNEAKRKWAAWQRLKDRATDTSVHLSDMPKGGGGGNPQERAMIGMVEAEEVYLKAKTELDAMREELADAMVVLKKWQHMDVIRKRYLEGKSISETMEEIGYEWSQTNRFLTEARSLINAPKME